MLFLAVRRFLVAPIRRVVQHITAYKDAPEDLAQIIEPNASITELHEAEEALRAMQIELSAALKQKARLASLGGAVAKISHDLRNMLTTAQLLADRIETSTDPAVMRIAPKLLNSLTRAVHLCESTLTYGKAEEPASVRTVFDIGDLIRDVIESELLTVAEGEVSIVFQPGQKVMIRADSEQVFRILSNLVRNAGQAIASTGRPGTVTIGLTEVDGKATITVDDDGPGLPPKAREHLFQPFEGGARKGGSGLGLAIASELVTGHGGSLTLVRSDGTGTRFTITLPTGQTGA